MANLSRRSFLRTSGVAALGITVAGCGDSAVTTSSSDVGGGIEKKLLVANWPDYTNPESYQRFQREFGPKVTVDTISSNEELIAKLSAGGGGYDVIVPSGSAVGPIVARDLAMELDQSLVPNLANIDPSFRDLSFDPGNRYSAIKDYGVTGWLYKKSVVPEPPATVQGWFELLPSLKGKQINLHDGPTEAPLYALSALGIDVNTTDADEYAEGMALLDESKSVVTSLNTAYIDPASQGQYDVTMAWSGDMPGIIAAAAENDIELGWFIDEQRGLFWTDNWVVAAGAEDPVAAHTWINWMLEPEVAQAEQDWLGYPIPVTGVTPTGQPQTSLPSDVLGRLQTITRSPELDALRSRAWDEYKS